MTSAHPDRAPRFAIPISMLYREEGDSNWLQGQTENISRSGVLFSAEKAIRADTQIHLLIEIPLEVGGREAGLSMCMARAVRTVDGARPFVAAAIVDCERLPDDPRRI